MFLLSTPSPLPSHPNHIPTPKTYKTIAIEHTQMVKIGSNLLDWYEDTTKLNAPFKISDCVLNPIPQLTMLRRYISQAICMYTYISTFFPDENFTLLSFIKFGEWYPLSEATHIPRKRRGPVRKNGPFWKYNFFKNKLKKIYKFIPYF